MRGAIVVSSAGGLASAAEPEAVEGAVSQSWSARSCSRASPPDSVAKFSLRLIETSADLFDGGLDVAGGARQTQAAVTVFKNHATVLASSLAPCLWCGFNGCEVFSCEAACLRDAGCYRLPGRGGRKVTTCDVTTGAFGTIKKVA